MRKFMAVLTLILALLFSVTGTCFVKPALAATVTVPDDYSAIQEAINVAVDGNTVFVKKGTYESPINQTLLITKSISIIGEDPEDTIILLHPEWGLQGWNYVNPVYDYDNAMEIQANNVSISGLTISGDGGKIVATGNSIKIRNNQISIPLLVNGLNQSIFDNTVTKGISCYGSYNSIFGNQLAGSGIIISGKGSWNLVYNNTVTGGYGISLAGYPVSDGNVVFNNTVKGCNIGLILWVKGSNNLIHANNIVNNDVGLELANEGDNTTVYHNNLIDNKIQVLNGDHVQGIGHFDDGKEGNYWSDYNGTDTDGDEIGDTPYAIDANNVDNYPLMSPFTVVTPQTSTPETPRELQPFPTTLVATASGVSIAVIGVGLLVYFKKRKCEAEQT